MMMMYSLLILSIPACFMGEWWALVLILMGLFFLVFNTTWFMSYYTSLSYSMGGDLLSWSLSLLSLWIVMLMIMASVIYLSNNNNIEAFLFIMLFLLLTLLTSFTFLNIFSFYIAFESSLIPTLLLIFGWGYQPERMSAGFYLLFYTLFGSLPLLISLFYIKNESGTLFYSLIEVEWNFYLYLSLIFAFLVKMPLIMFHFWLLKAHVEAPVSGSMVLAGVLLKLGGYGLLRVFSFMDKYVISLSYFFIVMSLFGMFIVGLLCMVQVDMKSLIAYSSVAHMGLVVCGIMIYNLWGLYGALVMMIGHGLCSSAMFSLANMVYERTHSRSLFINSGLIGFMPSMSLLWFLLSINNMSSPPSLNLLGEVMLINGVMSWSSYSWLFLGLASFMSCCYSIYLYSYSQHGMFYSGMMAVSSGYFREFLLIMYHWIPLNVIIMKVDFLVYWI
uniref:NADH-ubiquinone oxidoreductase chain 4 n=1 Tax=Alloeorhynchus sp. TaxID=2931281 RepID=A0A8T9ZXP4_9HEMI|nr:NADH dehydrogenase subunit 4 [Alloeorhynchus sp.]